MYAWAQPLASYLMRLPTHPLTYSPNTLGHAPSIPVWHFRNRGKRSCFFAFLEPQNRCSSRLRQVFSSLAQPLAPSPIFPRTPGRAPGVPDWHFGNRCKRSCFFAFPDPQDRCSSRLRQVFLPLAQPPAPHSFPSHAGHGHWHLIWRVQNH